MKKLLAVILLLSCFSELQAQVVINDPGMVAGLTANVPNAMSGNILDDTHPDVIGLQFLNLSNHGIIDLNGLQYFPSVYELYMDGNPIDNFFPLPPGQIDYIQSDFPTSGYMYVPGNVGHLDIAGNASDVLLEFDPVSTLYWCTVSLHSGDLFIGILPNSLALFHTFNTNITQMSDLGQLQEFMISGSQYFDIPLLPGTLQRLDILSSTFTELPELPWSLVFLALHNTPVNCLPTLPDGLIELDLDLNPFLHCIPNVPPNLINTTPLPVCNIFIDPLCSEPNVSGTVFNDVNGDGIHDIGELPVPNAIVELQPGDYEVTTDASGNYQISLPVGNFTVQSLPNGYQTITTAPIAVSIIDTSTMVTGVDHGIQWMPNIQDLYVYLTSSADPRPGFTFEYTISYGHPASQLTSGTITADFDPTMQWVSADPLPDSQTGTTATWNYSNLANGSTGSISVFLKTPGSTPLGTIVQHTVDMEPIVGDVEPSDNSAILQETVIGSYDPNDKLVYPTQLEEAQVQAGAFIDYTIRFQNTGTASAISVSISDQLSDDLQWNSFEFISSSHPMQWMRQEQYLSFLFENINLPDSNANEQESHGFVRFRIMPNTGLVSGDVIPNKANIYFDYNEPIVTNEALFGVSLPQLSLKAWLGGPYNGGVRMPDDLRDAGLIPTSEPYSGLGYVPIGPQISTVDPGVLANNNVNTSIVDWVVVELRDKNDPTLVVRSRYALIQRIGDIVDLDGSSPVFFDGLIPDQYYILVWHRNHLATMTAIPHAIGEPFFSLDFKSISTPTWGSDAQKNMSGKMALWPGDMNSDGQVKYTGLDNDRDPILVEIGGLVPTDTTTGYKGEDVNMDGIIKYTGTNNDRDPILQTIGGTVPTSVRNEQVP